MVKILLLLLIPIFFLNETVNSQSKVTGYVYSDTTTFNGVDNCQVLLFKKGKRIAKTKTDNFGHYSFGKLIPLEDVTMIFKKKCYSSIKIIHISSEREDFFVDILLRKEYPIDHELFEGSTKLYRMSPSG